MVTTEKRDAERRKHHRRPILENAYLGNAGRDYLGTISNYSPDGIFVRSKRVFDVGEEITLLCPRPENRSKVTLETARVVRKEPHGFALKFVDRKK
jgi:Tfp pilus assembly protein PilZ